MDDDPDFMAVLETVLADLGYRDVVTASSGREALDLIGTSPSSGFDVFIFDIVMPGMDGIELTRHVRALDAHRDTPIMMNTAMADRVHIEKAFAAGATDYLTKPVDVVEMKARLLLIESLVEERKRARNVVVQQAHGLGAGPSYGFMDGIPLKRVDGAVDLFTMGNYVKTLGIFRARSVAAIGIAVSNARAIHDLEGGHAFGEVMIDVATCIADCLRQSNRMIAYAGGGAFVCLMPRAEVGDPDSMADQLRECVMEFGSVYHELDIQLPTITVGQPICVRPSQLGTPMRIIDEAIASIRSNVSGIANIA
ncbi:response regulator [Roseibacterium sp. SDUM158016]|uniref:response regulator n=1 Tax=Roseicyclus sediminis TaxID=2980997 RepID=UPI0021D3E6DE|nr:response regulator [Roseibacterium sp. SDUM158016]MCU4654304.1 response regulator [Roseibacterium sp. SDUM158016]